MTGPVWIASATEHGCSQIVGSIYRRIFALAWNGTITIGEESIQARQAWRLRWPSLVT